MWNWNHCSSQTWNLDGQVLESLRPSWQLTELAAWSWRTHRTHGKWEWKHTWPSPGYVHPSRGSWATSGRLGTWPTDVLDSSYGDSVQERSLCQCQAIGSLKTPITQCCTTQILLRSMQIPLTSMISRRQMRGVSRLKASWTCPTARIAFARWWLSLSSVTFESRHEEASKLVVEVPC